jgi:prepilin-type N-terminal cleavage/methylation domain-containing protein
MRLRKKTPRLFRATSFGGFTLIELIIVVLIIAILTATAGFLFSAMRQKACTTIARYDLKKFFEAEQVYLINHNEFKGAAGDIISNAPGIESTFVLESYLPSRNTYIVIINDNPFLAQAHQVGYDVTFECNVQTGLITER